MELDATRENLREAIAEVEESKERLSSLSERLRRSAEARAEAEELLKEAVVGRSETAREMEELRRQRDVFRRRIEFCIERGAAPEWKCELREFSGEEMIMATENFSEKLRLKSGGDWTAVYKGRVNLQNVAIKVINASLPDEDFLLQVNLQQQNQGACVYMYVCVCINIYYIHIHTHCALYVVLELALI